MNEQEFRKTLIEVLAWVFALLVLTAIIMTQCGCLAIPTSIKKPMSWRAGHEINYPVLHFRMLKLESEAGFMLRVMDAIKDTDYIRVRPLYAESLNCEGLPGGKRLDAVAVYYAKEK